MVNNPSKVIPHNLEAEESFLGSILLDKDAIIKIADIIIPEDFYRNVHAIIFESMLELYSRREPIDLLSLGNRLEELKCLEKIGGRSYLISLSNAVPTSAHVINYANIIQKKATLRRLIDASYKIAELAFDESLDPDIVLDKSEQQLFAVSQKHLRKDFYPIKDILSGTFERIDEIHKDKGKLKGVRSGFTDLDNMLAGFQKSDLIILAARPSVGKTALALNFAEHAAVKLKIPTAIFSLEMSKEQLVDRLLSLESQVDSWKMRTGNLSEEDFPKIGHAMGALSEAPLFIDDGASCNVLTIRTKARRLQMEHNLGLLVIDYLQLMEGPRSKEGRNQEVSEISRMLKLIAKELNIPVIALSQLNRSVETRTPPIPKLADLRESGSIEQDADVVMFIYREDRYKTNSPPTNVCDIIVAKHRNGPIGKVQLYFDATKTKFKNLNKQYSNNDSPPPPPEAQNPNPAF